MSLLVLTAHAQVEMNLRGSLATEMAQSARTSDRSTILYAIFNFANEINGDRTNQQRTGLERISLTEIRLETSTPEWITGHRPATKICRSPKHKTGHEQLQDLALVSGLTKNASASVKHHRVGK